MLGMGGRRRRGEPPALPGRVKAVLPREGGRRGGGSGQLVDCSALQGGLAEETPRPSWAPPPSHSCWFPTRPEGLVCGISCILDQAPPTPQFFLWGGGFCTQGGGLRMEEAAVLLLGHEGKAARLHLERPCQQLFRLLLQGGWGDKGRDLGMPLASSVCGPATGWRRGGCCSWTGPWQPLRWEVPCGGAASSPPFQPGGTVSWGSPKQAITSPPLQPCFLVGV